MLKTGSRKLTLSDFNIHHFKPDGEDLQAILPSYEEYRVIVRESGLDEDLIPKSQYFQHQRIVHQLMQSPDMDRLLITHEAGSGKTGTYLGVAQYAKHQWLRHLGDRLNQPIIRKTLFLTTGSPQANDIRRMLVCTFGGTEYLARGKSPTSQRILIDNLVKKWYEIIPYRIFTARMLLEARKEGLTTIEYIRRKYAGYLVIADEFHGFRIDVNELEDILNRMESEDYEGLVTAKELRESDLVYDEGLDNRPRGKGMIDSRSAISKRMVVEAMLNLADYAPNIKMIIGSATLIVNDRDDLKTPMMAILKGELRREFLELDLYNPPQDDMDEYINDDNNLSDEEIRLLNEGDTNSPEYQEMMDGIKERVLEHVLHPYLMNRVSYVGSLVGKWKKVPVGERITVTVNEYGDITSEEGRVVDQPIIVYPVPLRGYQKRIYRRVYRDSTITQGKKRIKDIYNSARQASIFVYPNGDWGNETFRQYIRPSAEKGFGYQFGSELDELFNMDTEENEIQAWKNLENYSTIYYHICRMLNDNKIFKHRIQRYDTDPNSSTYQQIINETRNIGVIAIYAPYVKGSGVILLGLILERFCGMSRFNTAGRIIGHREASLDAEQGSDIVSDYCPSPGSSIVNLEKKPRYAIIHSSTSLSVLDNAKNILKSNDNVNGDYIRVALIPKEGREGVSINSATAFIRVGSDWNPAENYQAEKRVFRENSSDFIIKTILNTDNADLIDKYIDNGALRIQVYDMVAVVQDRDGVIDWSTSIGAQIQGNNVRRDTSNAPIRRILKRVAIDCHLNRRRNTLPAEMDGSPECDYKKCNYGCYTQYDHINSQIITTNYNNMFYDSGSDIIANLIVRFFQEHKETSITYLIRYIEKILQLNREVFIPILRSLEDLIRRQVEFTNLYGYSTHIMTSRGRVYISNGNVDNYHYIDNLHGQRADISTTIEEIRYSMKEELLSEFVSAIEDLHDVVIPDMESNQAESRPFIRTIRSKFYSHPDAVLILEAALQARFSKGYKSNPYIEGILYVTRNHWNRIPYPDLAIDAIKLRGTTSAAQGRKIMREVSLNYRFKPTDSVFRSDRLEYIIHDLAAWRPGVTLSTFYNADGPFRVARIGKRRLTWREYRADGTRLIEYHAFREAFRRRVTQLMFDDNNDMIINENETTPIYGVVLGNNQMVIIDHTLTQSRASRNTRGPITSSTAKVLPYLKTEEGAIQLFQYINDQEPTREELREFLNQTKNVINQVRESVIYNNDIVYL